jgi:hypothetical protein
MGTIRIKKQVAPATPIADYVEIYVDTADGIIKTKDENGLVTGLKGVDAVDTTANLNALPRVEGKIYYATDTDKLLIDNGAVLSNSDNTGADGVDTLANLTALGRSEGKIYYATDTDLLYTDDGATLNPVDTDTTGVDGIDTLANLTALGRSEGKIYYATDTDILYTDDGAALNAVGGGGGGTLAALTDTTITAPAGSDTLVFNGITSKWENVAAPSLAGIGIFQDTLAKGSVEQIAIETIASSTDFADMLTITANAGAASSSTRMIFVGSIVASDTMEYQEYSNPVTFIDFANLLTAKSQVAGSSNETKALWFGGNITNDVTYNTISSLTDTIDFANMTRAVNGSRALGNQVRAIVSGGDFSVDSYIDMDYFNYAITFVTTDFGDMGTKSTQHGAVSNSVTGLLASVNGAVASNIIESLTIAAAVGSSDHSDLTVARKPVDGAGSGIRAVWGGGTSALDYSSYASTTNAQVFGNLPSAYTQVAATSNSHGGL